MTAESKGASVLARLASEVMDGKKAEARKLTPVAGEAAPAVLPKTQETFPNDFPQEVIEQKVGDLTRIINHLTEARDALAGLVDAPLPEKVVDLKAVQKAKEAAADFNADFRAKQEAAQAEVYKAAAAEGVIPVEDILPLVGGEFGWTCPTHGKAIEKTSQKTGRTFIGCPECNLFRR